MKATNELQIESLTFMNDKEMENCNGGNILEDIAYKIGYALGFSAYGVYKDIQSAAHGTYRQSAGSAAMHSALG